MHPRLDAPPHLVNRLREICRGLPESYEEDAWVGTRWCVRKKNFAHIVPIEDGWPPAYVKAAGSAADQTILTFRSAGAELAALTAQGPPYFKPAWWHDIVGVVLDDDTDWEEVHELLTESYCLLAPKTLAARVTRPSAHPR